YPSAGSQLLRRAVSLLLRQFSQRFRQLGQAVDFSYNPLQFFQSGRDVLKKVFMTFDQPEKTVRTQRLHQALHGTEPQLEMEIAVDRDSSFDLQLPIVSGQL